LADSHKTEKRRRNDSMRLKFQPMAAYRNNKGIAVILALSVVLLLVTAALELHINERTNLLNAAAARDRVKLEQMTAAGIHLAMAILVKDRLESEADSLQEDWADPETVAAMIGEIPFEEGRLELKIVDEMSKIQVNALVQFPEGRQFKEPQRKMWERFALAILSLYEEEAGDTDPLTIINSIKDWLDSGDDDAITGLNGAESDYYESLDPPYACKNGPFDDLSEVRLVKGITPEIFFGLGGSSGLGEYLTVYGMEKSGDQNFTYPGAININTAELPVLTALLPAESAGFAQSLIDYREAISGTQFTNDVTHAGWYKNVPGFSDITIDQSLISIASSTFRIIATATLHDMKATTVAVVQREKPSESDGWQSKILNWKVQ
jgi:general secretion pathway protein K